MRFFLLAALRFTAAALRRPATLAPQAPLARLQRAFASPRPAAFVAPCSLGAFLSPPPNPQAVLVPRNLLAGVAAPLLFCAPACASARRFPLWSAKAHLVSPPHRCHPCPQWLYWCLPLRGRRRKGTPAAASD